MQRGVLLPRAQERTNPGRPLRKRNEQAWTDHQMEVLARQAQWNQWRCHSRGGVKEQAWKDIWRVLWRSLVPIFSGRGRIVRRVDLSFCCPMTKGSYLHILSG